MDAPKCQRHVNGVREQLFLIFAAANIVTSYHS